MAHRYVDGLQFSAVGGDRLPISSGQRICELYGVVIRCPSAKMELDVGAVVSDAIDHGRVRHQSGNDVGVLEFIGDIRTVASRDDGAADPQFACDVRDGVTPRSHRRDGKWTYEPDVVGENDPV